MSIHTATIRWGRGDQRLTDSRYSRGHAGAFGGGVESMHHRAQAERFIANAVTSEVRREPVHAT
jgi:hypothetical protein